MEYATLAGYVIMLILGIAFVIMANRDYADGQCRTKFWGWLLGIFWIVVGGISTIMLIYTMATTERKGISE
jgi:uncharacterized membrane protein